MEAGTVREHAEAHAAANVSGDMARAAADSPTKREPISGRWPDSCPDP